MSNFRSSLLKVRIYPSLDFTLGQQSPPKADKREGATEIKEGIHRFWHGNHKNYEVYTDQKAVDRAVEQQTKGERLTPEKVTKLLEVYETEYSQALEEGNQARADNAIAKIERLSVCPSLMGLSTAVISHKTPRKRRGLAGITSFGKKIVRSSLAILERKYSRERLTMGTCTLPALTQDEFDLICSNWSELVRQFFQELTRELIRKGLEAEYVHVTEIQERRFDSRGEVGLHLHWLIPGKPRQNASWVFTPTEIRELWQRLLTNMLGREVDCSAATRIEKPRKSLLAEMSKYLTKGTTAIAAVVAAGKEHQLPSAWWGAARPLKHQVKSEIIEISGLAALWLDRNLKRLKGDTGLWYVDIYVENKGHEFRAGAAGRFNSQKEVEQLKMMHEILAIQDGHSILELFS